MTTAQNQASTAQLHALQVQETAIRQQLAAAEASLKSYEKQFSGMSSAERDLEILVRQNKESKVAELRGDLDAVRQKLADVRNGVADDRTQTIVRVQDGPLIVTDAPTAIGTTEPPFTLFGLTTSELRGPAEFLLLFPLVIALSRWIWRRSPVRPNREYAIDANPQITRLEQAVESIAIEVERISEAQRFSAKLMAERPKEPVIERIREAAKPVRRVVTPLP